MSRYVAIYQHPSCRASRLFARSVHNRSKLCPRAPTSGTPVAGKDSATMQDAAGAQRALQRRQELADFLRTRRARLTPAEVGLPKGFRRNTPGLRRNEVASLAGVSEPWYTWLEQGRDIHPSVQVLESIGRALRLNADEQAYLLTLAQREVP